MGSVQKRTDGKWRTRYRDAAGKEHARHFGRKIDAQRWVESQETAKSLLRAPLRRGDRAPGG
jgi:hypothetical protein